MNAKSPESQKHTPGPWHTTGAIVYAPNGWAVANAIVFHGKHNQNESEINARLIASAPELLEALLLCVASLEEVNPKADTGTWLRVGRAIHEAGAVIAKAEGREVENG